MSNIGAIIGVLIWAIIIAFWKSNRKNKKNNDNSEDKSIEANTIETEAATQLKVGGIVLETETEKLIDTILEILIAEGFRPLLFEKENYIEFKIERNVVRVQFYQDDENYIQLGCWIYDYKQEYKNDALDTANHINIHVKYANIAIHSDQIIAHSDFFVDGNMDVKATLFKHISAILYAKDEFYRLSKEYDFSLN